MKRKIDIAAQIILIVGAVNLGLIGWIGLDMISQLFGGQTAIASRAIYIMIGLAGLWCVGILVKRDRIRV